MYEPLDFVTMGQRWVMWRNLIGRELNLCVGLGRSAVGPRMSRTRPMQAMKATPDLSCPRSHRFRGEIRSSFFMLFPGPCRRAHAGIGCGGRFRRAADVAAHLPGELNGAAGSTASLWRMIALNHRTVCQWPIYVLGLVRGGFGFRIDRVKDG